MLAEVPLIAVWCLLSLLGVLTTIWVLGIRYTPHDKVGIVEKLWSLSGFLREGRIIATSGKAGVDNPDEPTSPRRKAGVRTDEHPKPAGRRNPDPPAAAEGQ